VTNLRANVAIVGRGAVTAFGAGCAVFTESMFAGRSAILPRRRTASFRAPTEVAAEIPDDVFPAALPAADRAFHIAMLAAREAFAEAGNPHRAGIGLILASTKADLSGVVGEGTGLGQPWRLARRLAASLELGGPVASVSCACASGLVALSVAARRISSGECEQLLVLGVDVLHAFVLAGFGSINALDPAACRPFDARRRGVSLEIGRAHV